jgi:predicted AlkP superfamily pyrophosphatase or phosphodiesterase
LEQPAINRLGGFPEADFIVASKAGYVFRDSLTGPLISETVNYVGSHGFMPDIPDMQSSFFIMGPGIPKHKNLGVISMLDIAPTLAKLQGFKLPHAEGKVLLQ